MISAGQLKQFDFFSEFTDAELEKLTTIAEEQAYPAGAQMYKKGDPAAHLFLVTKGKIILVLDSYVGPHKPPLQVTLDIITKGESMGWSAVVNPFIYTLGALCIDESDFIAIDAPKLRELMEEDCTMGFKVMKSIGKVLASRLNHTRIILVGERGLSHLSEY
ncbi:MAG: cyclic nucleotide-binding domain-containing protein [Syntrophaceae bacterium]|nr:cyclic nucleotide-binding domain-containing protein [Syntrophaceae bacterium]